MFVVGVSLQVNPNIKVPCYDNKDKAPLHVAAERGHSETVYTLLEHCGAGVDVRDAEGETPLHCAVINEFVNKKPTNWLCQAKRQVVSALCDNRSRELSL